MSFRENTADALLAAIDAILVDEAAGRLPDECVRNAKETMQVAFALIVGQEHTDVQAIMAVNDLTATLDALPADDWQMGRSSQDCFGARGAMKDAIKILTLTASIGGEVPQFEARGCCGALHRSGYSGDCRDDTQRFDADELDELLGPMGWIETEPVDENRDDVSMSLR